MVLTQISIFLSLGAAGFPAIKKTVLDLVTNFGVSEDSANRSKKGNSYRLTPLSKRTKQSSSAPRSTSSFSPYTGWRTENTIVGPAAKRALSDDGSEKSIMPQGVIEVAHSFTVEVDTASQRYGSVGPHVTT